MTKSDVLIVGGGPAGSTCAHRLHHAGWHVVLLDRKPFPRVKPCAGWITPQVVEALDIDLAEYQTQHTLQPITEFRTGIIGGKMVETRYSEPVSYGIRRIEFDHFLLQRSGANYRNEAVRKIEHRDGHWQVNDQYQAPLLIGAGGHFCPVARYLRKAKSGGHETEKKPPDPDPIVVYAQEAEWRISELQQREGPILPERPELYFCRDLKGYGWCFRKGEYLNVGLGRTDKSELSDQVSQFGEFLRESGRLLEPLPEKFLGHAYRLYAQTQPELVGDGLMLIGDAAGLAYPQSGEGIRPAIESAILAANVAIEGNGNYSRQALDPYASELVDRLGEARPLSTIGWLPAAWLQRIAATLMATRWFARKFVINDWFLRRNDAAMVETSESEK